VFVDYSSAACKTITENLENCGFGDRAVVRRRTLSCTRTRPHTHLGGKEALKARQR
jgi:hypothetical protein